VETIAYARDTFYLSGALETAQTHDDYERLVKEAWSHGFHATIATQHDEQLLYPALKRASSPDEFYALFAQAMTTAGGLAVRYKREVWLRRSVTRRTSQEDLLHRAQCAHDGETRQWLWAIYDVRYVLPKLPGARTESDFLQIQCEALSMYGKQRVAQWQDQQMLQRLHRLRTKDEFKDLVLDLSIAENINLAKARADKVLVLDRLSQALSEDELNELRSLAYLDTTMKRLNDVHNERFVIPRIIHTSTDTDFRSLYERCWTQATRETVAQAHLAWLKKQYGDDLAELPEAILMDPPQYLVQEIRKALHPDLA